MMQMCYFSVFVVFICYLYVNCACDYDLITAGAYQGTLGAHAGKKDPGAPHQIKLDEHTMLNHIIPIFKFIFYSQIKQKCRLYI